MTTRTDQTHPSSIFLKPEPITRQGIQTYNPQTLYIYQGKKGLITFEPLREKGPDMGTALGTIFKKANHTEPTPKEWMGKVGDLNGFLRNDPASARTVTQREINLSVVQEKIAADFYKELGRGMFDVPKTRLARLPVSDRFTQGHGLANEWMIGARGVIETLRVMSRFVDGYKDFTQARTREAGRNYSFMEYIRGAPPPPRFFTHRRGELLVPLNGFIGLFQRAESLPDIDSVGGDGGNAGFVWLRDESGVITAAQTVKIDPGFAFQFDKPGNWAFNTRQNNKGRKLDDIRDIPDRNEPPWRDNQMGKPNPGAKGCFPVCPAELRSLPARRSALLPFLS